MKIKKLLEKIFYPKECVGCGREEVFLCENCFKKIKISDEIIYEFPNFNPPPCFSGIIIVSEYKSPLKEIIRNLKFKGIKELAIPIGDIVKKRIQILPEILQEQIYKESIIIPMPLSRRRKIKRGFNQVEVISLQIFKKDVIYPYILCKKEAIPQTKLKKEKRIKNIKNKFKLSKNSCSINGKNVVLIDDVITTGATFFEAIKVLSKAKPRSIWGIVIAKD